MKFPKKDVYKYFDKKLMKFKDRKSKYLLKKKYQIKALKLVKEILKKFKKNKDIDKIWIGGSLVKYQLGIYAKRWNERMYSDIDVFILLTKPISKLKLNQIDLVKKLYFAKGKNKAERYYRISVSDNLGNPIKILGFFSMDVWLFSPKSYKEDIKKFPNLLKGAIEVK